MYIKESILDNIDKSEERSIPTIDASTEEWPEWMFIMEATPIIGKSPIKDGRSIGALNRLFEYFGVPYNIWYLDGREFSEADIIDHSADGMFNKGEYFVCFMFDFPETVREQVQLIINLMNLYWNTFWGYSDVYVYRYDGVMYIDVPERTKNLVAAAYDISGFSFYLKHSDAKSNYQLEGKKLTELKMKIYNMLPDSSFTSVETAGRYIDSLIKVRKRRLKKFRHCGDENGNDVKWRPITEGLLDNIEKSDAHSSDVLSANATDGNPLDYNNFYLFNIETEVDIEPFCEGVRPIFDKYKINYMFKTYTRSEIRELPWADLQKKAHFMRSDKFLCIFFDKFPVTMVRRVQWLLKIITVYIQEFSDDVSIYRFEKNDADIFILKSEGHVVRTRYKGYFGLYDGPDRKSYDDTLFVSQFATLLNTSDHAIYFEVKPILKKIRDRFLDWKSKKLTESVLDDLEHNALSSAETVSSNFDSDILDYQYLFLINTDETENISEFSERVITICDMYGLQSLVKTYTRQEISSNNYIVIDRYLNPKSFNYMKYDTFICIFVDRIPDTHEKQVMWLLKLFTVYYQEFENIAKITRFDNSEGKFVSKINDVRSLDRSHYKWFFSESKNKPLYAQDDFISCFSAILFRGEGLFNITKKILMDFRKQLRKRAKTITESVLDDLEHNEITQDDIVRVKQQALYYDEMYLFNVVPLNTEVNTPLELIGDLADAMAIDIYMEPYDEGDFDDVEYIDHSDDDSFQTSSQLCVYINQPTSDYDKAKFLIMLMEIISHEYETGTDVRLYRKNSRDMFEMNKRIERTMMQIYNMWCLRIRDIKEGRDVQSLMSYGSTIAVYQDVCNLLYFNTNPKMNCVERAIRNLMKRPMFMNESRLNESILDNIERTSADSAADLSGKSTDDDEDKFDFHKYERFTHMFQFCVSGESDNPTLIEFLNARGIDYEILQAGSDEWKSIDWINRNIALNGEPDTYLCVFVNLPARMYYRLRLIMGICSAVCDDYNDAVSNDIYKYVLENVSRHEKMFICRAVARQVVVRSDQLNNYFNGGITFSDRSELYVQLIRNNWKNNIVNIVNYAYSDRNALNAIDEALAMLYARLQKIKKHRNISD